MDYLLDPFVIQMPKPFESKTHLTEYLSSLSEWCKLLDEPTEDKFWFSAPALEELWSSGQFPRYTQLREIFDDIGDQNLEFDVVTASRACEKLNNPPYIDDRILELCPDANNIIPEELILIPEEIEKRLSPQVAKALIETFIKLAFIHEHLGIIVFEDLFFATRSLEKLNEHIEIKAHCYDIQSSNYFDIEDQWLSVCDPSKFLDIEKNWKDTRRMVKWAYDDLISRGLLDAKQVCLPQKDEWCIGKHFNDSIEQNHFNKPNELVSIFHTLTKVLVGFWPRETETKENHFLQRDNRQIMREKDGAMTWRAWVTNYVPRIRLHYWVVDNHIEISEVVPHGVIAIK